MTGATTGPTNNPVSTVRSAGPLRAMPSAAAVPARMDTIADSAATLRLVSSARGHDGEQGQDQHHRDDRGEDVEGDAAAHQRASASVRTGTKRPAIARMSSEAASSTIDPAAASGQFRRSLTRLSISIDRVRLAEPPSSIGVTKKPSDSRKTKVAAVAMPRADSGSSTRRNVVT